MLMPPNDPTREKPLDHPTPERPHRLYVAMTNHCNRACPWCSTCSSPRGETWLTIENYVAGFPALGTFQVQLEGGEPTLHPQFWDFVRIARKHPRCTHLVLCTNGVVLPRRQEKLRDYISKLGAPLTLKLSINHYLLDHDKGLIALAVSLRDIFAELGGDLVLNVRLRRGVADDDHHVRERVEAAGLMPISNIFYLQRYGFASGETDWEPPAPVWHAFTLMNPDGQIFGSDLIARSEAMRVLVGSGFQPAAGLLPGAPPFNPHYRREKYRAFDLFKNSTARSVVNFNLWNRPVTVYANANLSLYSAQPCNAACRFCVEELRPASRGGLLSIQKSVEQDDVRYFQALEETLNALRPLSPTLSITGGEPSKDPRLPRILKTVAAHPAPRKTLTTNASGLFDARLIDRICEARLNHLNISVAHPDRDENVRLMRLKSALLPNQLAEIVRLAASAGTRVRLSCVLLREGIYSLESIIDYLAFAQSLGVDNVIFRQLMQTDPTTHAQNTVVNYSNLQRVSVEPILDQIGNDPRFTFVRQILGYYYYVEVWRYSGMDVVFEEADLAQLEIVKQRDPGIIHELVFHPNARLASTWQPWDGELGPPACYILDPIVSGEPTKPPVGVL